MPLDRLVVVADAHLGRGRDGITDLFLRFLRAAPGLGDGLLLAGDLFEFRFGDAHEPAAHAPVLAGLAEVAARVPTTFVGGNHDRWGSLGWATGRGIRAEAESVALEVAGRRVVAEHGDRQGQVRLSRRVAHALVSSPLASAVYAALPAAIAFPLVERWSARSGAHRDDPVWRARAAERQRAAARARLGTADAPEVLVLAHSHVATVEELMPGRWLVNPGAFYEGGRHAVVGRDLRLAQLS